MANHKTQIPQTKPFPPKPTRPATPLPLEYGQVKPMNLSIRAIASRANGALSRGPRTEEGKRRSYRRGRNSAAAKRTYRGSRPR
jgi:hypothetical protein